MKEEYNEIIKALSLDFIQKYIPEEVEVFDEISEDFFEDPSSFEHIEAKDSALGFGLGDIIALGTPAIIGMLSILVNKLSEPLLKGAIEFGAEILSEVSVKLVAEGIGKGLSDSQGIKHQMLEAATKYGIPKANQEEFVNHFIQHFKAK